MKICLSCEGVTNTQAQRCGHCGAWLLPTDFVHYPVRLGETDSGNPLLGTVIDGKYRLQSVLGRGGLGTVFSAMHIGSLMTVALKLLHPRFTGRPEYRRALLPEARRAATVTHTRCARLLDVGEVEEGVAYLAMELAEGKTLEVLMRGGRMAPSHAVDILLQVAEALEAIHAAGLVHCDLSPRNVMVAQRGGQLHVKVLDFGIARSVTLAGGEPAPGSELTGFVNPAFSAPELLARGKVDPRADLYSLGTLAWLLLTGGMPIDDTDARRAALAVAAGELRPWPRVVGVPRVLQRLVQACMSRDPERRPASATAVRLQLEAVRNARRPKVAGTAVAAAAMVAVSFALGGESPSPPFLELETRSDVKLVDPTEAVGALPQALRSEQLAELSFLYGGFEATSLRAHVSQGGEVWRMPLRPVVDGEAGTLQLSMAQPQWREVVQYLANNSGKRPMDLSFVVPGAGSLGTARVRVDDTPPRLEAHLDELENGVIVGRSLLVWAASDEIGLASTFVEVVFADGSPGLEFPLRGPSDRFELGKAIGERVESVGTLGSGTLVVRARDPAGNESRLDPIAFEQADVGVPVVVEVTGPGGEGYVPWSGDQAMLRVKLSALEANCSLQVYGDDGALLKKLPLADGELIQTIVVPPPATNGGAGVLDLRVVDAFGNRSAKQCNLQWRDRTPRLELEPVRPGVCRVGRELVLAGAGRVVVASAGQNLAVVGGALELATAQGIRDAGAEFRSQAASDGTCRLEFGTLPPGSHLLRLEVQEREGLPGVMGPQEVAVRVLPEAIEVRIPSVRSRYLQGLVDADLLAARGAGYREGPGWLVNQAERPYLRGTLWVGADTRVSLPLPPRESPADPLLPEVTPVSGHNVLAIDLRDVLDRPVRLLAGDGVIEQVDHDGRALSVIADFWFNEDAPVQIGEELLGEHGQPARLQLRFPLPFLPHELGELQLQIAQSQIQAAELKATGGDACIVRFELPFEVWSIAAGLLGKSREDFAEQLESKFEVTVETPAGDYPLTLRVRTTRSTLRPVALADLGDVRGPLASIRLVPVLAPGGPFKEPVPEEAPPRAVFRPQTAVEVRNFSDILLQDREFCCGEARALMQQLDRAHRLGTPQRFVHDADPLKEARLSAENLLPARATTAPDDELLTGVDFFQAYTLCRLLGQAVADDPGLFRLPLGCELELAAFGSAPRRACNGVAAHEGAVDMRAFLAAAQILARGAAPTAADTRAAGDRILVTAYGVEFLGLDFGVREWVMDVPHVTGSEDLIAEWIADHSVHLAHVVAMAEGLWKPPSALIDPLRTMGVVRGLALGEREGLVRLDGTRLDPGTCSVVPETVPGVVRTEQLLRDGNDLLSQSDDPRLARTGFRVVAAAAALAGLRGRR